MKCLSDVHVHSTWCDGRDDARTMALRAVELGFTDLGFSSHANAPFDGECFGVIDGAAYRADIAALKEEFAGRLAILCGAEQDTYAPVSERGEYDYIIGSHHYLRLGGEGELMAVDGGKGALPRCRDLYFGGDALALARGYYEEEARGVRLLKPDIAGHFDLILKYNTVRRVFDEDSTEYRAVALQALDEVLDVLEGYGGMLEVNTGAMSRGWRTTPYPADFLLRRAAERRARVIITGDSHAAATLGMYFGDALAYAKSCGFGSMAILSGGKFRDVKI